MDIENSAKNVRKESDSLERDEPQGEEENLEYRSDVTDEKKPEAAQDAQNGGEDGNGMEFDEQLLQAPPKDGSNAILEKLMDILSTQTDSVCESLSLLEISSGFSETFLDLIRWLSHPENAPKLENVKETVVALIDINQEVLDNIRDKVEDFRNRAFSKPQDLEQFNKINIQYININITNTSEIEEKVASGQIPQFDIINSNQILYKVFSQREKYNGGGMNALQNAVKSLSSLLKLNGYLCLRESYYSAELKHLDGQTEYLNDLSETVGLQTNNASDDKFVRAFLEYFLQESEIGTRKEVLGNSFGDFVGQLLETVKKATKTIYMPLGLALEVLGHYLWYARQRKPHFGENSEPQDENQVLRNFLASDGHDQYVFLVDENFAQTVSEWSVNNAEQTAFEIISEISNQRGSHSAMVQRNFVFEVVRRDLDYQPPRLKRHKASFFHSKLQKIFRKTTLDQAKPSNEGEMQE